MKNILVISGHTDLNNSVANMTILGELERNMPEAEYVYLDQLYPEFRIDVKKEQERLVRADVIVLQFPIFWYAMPSLMGRWMEEVFQHGFSHGSTGDKLKGKQVVASFTTGAPEATYSYEGPQHYPVEDFLPPLKAACNLCGMEFAGYIYTGGVSYQGRDDAAQLEQMNKKSVAHAGRVVRLLQTL